MYNRVLVPLDGSSAGEQALRILREWLACGQIAEAILARVERPAQEVVMDYVLHDASVAMANEKALQSARRYLDEVSQRIDWGGVAHREVAVIGDPVLALARLAEEERVDLVLTAKPKSEQVSRRERTRVLRAFSVPVLELTW